MIGDQGAGEAWRSEPEALGTDPLSYRSEYQQRARERARRRAEQRRRRRKAVLLALSVMLWIGLVRWPGPVSQSIAGLAVLAAMGFAAYHIVRFAIEEHRRQ